MYIFRERVVISQVMGGVDSFSLHSSKYTQTLTNGARKRYKQKLSYNVGIGQLPGPYALLGWTNDPNVWPNLTVGDIYLIESPALFDKKGMKAKALKPIIILSVDMLRPSCTTKCHIPRHSVSLRLR